MYGAHKINAMLHNNITLVVNVNIHFAFTLNNLPTCLAALVLLIECLLVYHSGALLCRFNWRIVLYGLNLQRRLRLRLRAAQLRAQGIDIIDLGLGQPDFDAATELVKACRDYGYTRRFTKYTPVDRNTRS